jgi:hypothetical protein
MLRDRRIIRSAARRIAQAAELSIGDLNQRLVEQEPHLTDRMLGRIAQTMEGQRKHGIMWTAKTLTDHGRGTQEKQYGADFVGVLDIAIPGYKVAKGFLAQSKLIKNASMHAGEFRRMVDQCKQMLELSPASYVFAMESGGIRVLPAVAVVASSGPEYLFSPDSVYSRKISSFYEAHFECFIGDLGIHEPSEDTLESLRARSLLYLAARTG